MKRREEVAVGKWEQNLMAEFRLGSSATIFHLFLLCLLLSQMSTSIYFLFLFLFHTTVSSVIFIGLLASPPLMMLAWTWSQLCEPLHLPALTHILWRINMLSLAWIWQGTEQNRAHHRVVREMVTFFSVNLVPWFHPSCFQIIRLPQKKVPTLSLSLFSLIGGEIVQVRCVGGLCSHRLLHFHVTWGYSVSLGNRLENPS